MWNSIVTVPDHCIFIYFKNGRRIVQVCSWVKLRHSTILTPLAPNWVVFRFPIKGPKGIWPNKLSTIINRLHKVLMSVIQVDPLTHHQEKKKEGKMPWTLFHISLNKAKLTFEADRIYNTWFIKSWTYQQTPALLKNQFYQQGEVGLIFIFHFSFFRFSLFVFRFSLFVFRYSNWVGKLYFDIQNPILTFELSRKILFWYSKSYLDIRT